MTGAAKLDKPPHTPISLPQKGLATGKTIEAYPEDQPYPSRLVLGWGGTRPIHVVVADNQAQQETILITVYDPDLARWEAGFERRRQR